MKNTAFMTRKLELFLVRQGIEYTFKRHEVDDRGQPTDKEIVVKILKGIFHLGSADYIQLVVGDAATVKSKHTQYIMTAWGEAENIMQGDFVEVNGIQRKVTGKTNIAETNVIADISLEEVI